MKIIYLVRHADAHAGKAGVSDYERPLGAKRRKENSKNGQAIKESLGITRRNGL